jgi:ACR3 family arsenite transporter
VIPTRAVRSWEPLLHLIGEIHEVHSIRVEGISIPIALGLLVMMYPVLAKVRYDRLDTATSDRRLLVSSLVLNWLLGPALMFALAWLLVPDLPEYRTGLIIVGLARCTAMVIIWNDLACGDREAAAVLVALNSLFRVAMFAVLGWFYLSVLPGWLGLQTASISTSPWHIVQSVLILLGIPLLAGYLWRKLGEESKGRAWYESRFLPKIGPWALYGLLFTVVILSALQGKRITSCPVDVLRIATLLLAYFAVMCGEAATCSARLSDSATSAPPCWPSPLRVTTLSSPSRWLSLPTVLPRVRPWPVSSARSSRVSFWSHSSPYRYCCASDSTGSGIGSPEL